ncbi:proteasome complex subunit Rpn13 ubiquitin receptor-domain-containing protein [Delphinella strobiligena]|nr:proteasome complex subunit Rpn13 ubiquitin receptor-domain-containing protein [Delphinella strobiligena]
MASNPIITFKAGQCELQGKKVKPLPTPGYLYLYEEDELLHFCWRPRSAPSDSPETDLLMFPGDGIFTPYTGSSNSSSADTSSPTNGRIFCLKFSSSSQRHFFWMQSKSQHREGKANWFSSRDKRLGDIINQLLSGEDVDVESEVRTLRHDGGADDDDDDVMEDAQSPDHGRRGSSTGGAGADATGGDPSEEGRASREGGADGGRAPTDANDAVQNFLRSLQGSNVNQQQSSQQSYDQPFTTLSELLNTNTTISFLSGATPMQIDGLCANLPPSLFLLAQESSASTSSAEPNPETTRAAIAAMSTEQKRELLARVLRTPQLNQSLGSLTVALRDGGLPMVAGALGVDVEHGGTVRGGTVPLGGGQAVEAFLNGVKRGVEKEEKK